MSFVQATNGATATSSTAFTSNAFASSTTNGNLIAVGVELLGATQAVTSVTDSKSNTYVAGPTATLSNSKIYGFYAKNIAGGASHTLTVNVSGGTVPVSIVAHEFSGRSPTAPLDQSNALSNAGGVQNHVGAGTPSPAQGGDDIFTFAADEGSVATEVFTNVSPWAAIPANSSNLSPSANYEPSFATYAANVAAGSYQGNYTTSLFKPTMSIIMAFVAAASATIAEGGGDSFDGGFQPMNGGFS